MPRKLAAEFIGTFLMVFVIVVAAATGNGGSPVGAALACGLVLAALITACGPVSGAQFNPAVSLALIFAGRQRPLQAGAYVAVQILAATAAAWLARELLRGPWREPDPAALAATIGTLTRAGAEWRVFAVEAVITFALMVSILAGTVDERADRLGGFTIGATVAGCIIAAGPLTGASMNPARTFGPAVWSGVWEMHAMYWAGPVFGATLATLVYRVVWLPRREGR